jgi:DNA-3-methyladenine glycosylase
MAGSRTTDLDFGRAVEVVARDLLGRDLVSLVGGGEVVVRLTEVEAYAGVGSDPGSHAHRGQTDRNAVMFGPPGHAYVSLCYGLHWMLNLVCEPGGRAAAVLLRAGLVVAGTDLARERRALPGARPDRHLALGPASLAQALGVTGDLDGTVLAPGGPLWVGGGAPVQNVAVDRGPRVGLGRDDGRPWRLWLAGDPTVSLWRSGRARTRQ